MYKTNWNPTWVEEIFMHWTTFSQIFFISIFVLGVDGNSEGMITWSNINEHVYKHVLLGMDGMGWDGWGGCQIVDPIGTYQKILAGQVQFPAHFSRRFYA